jgi:glutathione-regulated potassium-efflux system protein KefB
MDLQSILLAVVVFLGATAICVILFERLGFGSVLGFIVAGILIGPHTPGPVPVHNVDELQNVAQLGVVLFLFTVGLEMRPEKVWSMRRLLFGLGSAQMLVTATVLAAYAVFVVDVPWGSAIILGLGFAMSSTAIIMATLGERGELATEHGQTSFAVLMAQDLWVVPVMALVPILAHKTAQTATIPLWEKISLVVGVIAGIFVVGRYLLPAVLGYCAKQRRMDAFEIVLFLAVIAAAWAVDHVGISMTLGAFLMGMLLSASDYRYQIEAIVAPFKGTLMGLFFIAVGMSIDVVALLSEWSSLLVHVPVVMLINTAVLIALALAFGIGRSATIRTGFYLSQVVWISLMRPALDSHSPRRRLTSVVTRASTLSADGKPKHRCRDGGPRGSCRIPILMRRCSAGRKMSSIIRPRAHPTISRAGIRRQRRQSRRAEARLLS